MLPDRMDVELPDVRLERWNPSLVDGLAAAFAAAEDDLRAWMPFAADEQSDASAFVAACDAAFDAGRAFAYAVMSGGEVAGYVNVSIDGVEGSMGYWLAPAARGRGWATAAVRTLAAAALRDVVDVVEADVDAANAASRRVLERAGFSLRDERVRPPRTPAQSDTELVFVFDRR